MLEFASTLDPKSKPCKLRKLGEEPKFEATPKQNYSSEKQDCAQEGFRASPVPEYAAYNDPLKKSPAFDVIEGIMRKRVMVIDGAMGTAVQKYKLSEDDFRGCVTRITPMT